MEEVEHGGPGGFGGFFVVLDGHSGESDDEGADWAVLVHEGVSGVGVDGDVVLDAELVEVLAQAVGLGGVEAIFASVGGDDGADAFEGFGLAGDGAVEVGGGADGGAGGVEDGESAAEAESGDGEARFVHVLAVGEPGSGGFDVVEGASAAAAQGLHGAADADGFESGSDGVEIGGEGDVAVVGEASGDATDVVVEAEDFVEDEDGGGVDRLSRWVWRGRRRGCRRLWGCGRIGWALGGS